VIAVTAEEMRALDRWTIEHGTPGHVLMERAGAGAARVLRDHLVRRGNRVVIVCGRGNNGGDGFVVARHMRRARVPVDVWLAARPGEVSGDAGRMLAAWRRGGGSIHELRTEAQVRAFAGRLRRGAVLVDALFGTGLNAPLGGVAAEIVGAVNASGAPVLAVDIASGLSADTGVPLGVSVRANVTATFGHPKVGQLVHPGVGYTGDLHVIDIGIPTAAHDAVSPTTVLLEGRTVARCLPPRPRDAHKGQCGHVLVVAGSRGKLGAALLAAEGAARAGAGLTTLAVPATLQPQCEGRVAEVMTVPLADAGEGNGAPGDVGALGPLLTARAAVVCGPGLGLHPATRALVTEIVRRCTVPLVLDADALNAVAGTQTLGTRAGPIVVTPHPGEMARLLGTDVASVQGDRPGAARRFARDNGVIVVLKGARTIVASPDGRAAISPTGNPGMASGGMGDVLAGVIGGLIAQGLSALEGATLGVFAHGAAGDAVAARRGEIGLLARDLMAELPPTVAWLQGAPQRGGGPRGRGRDGVA
jgi:NAD(P)H-hydrate epimerase